MKMPKYIITCTSMQEMQLCVEAPTEEAARDYYHEFHFEGDYGEFWPGKYFKWEYSHTEKSEIKGMIADVRVNADGEPVDVTE